MSFDLRKYLANNPLLNEGLSNKEQMVVDDILSVTEGPKDVYNKLVSYGKKGMMSLAIVASVLTGCAEQGDMDSAKATIEYAIENEWAGSELEKLGLIGGVLVDIDDAQVGGDDLFMSNASTPEERDQVNKDVMFTQASLYFYDLMKGKSKEEAESNVKGIGEMTQEMVLDYIRSIENKIESNPTESDKYFRYELKKMVDGAKDGKLNPMYLRLIKY